VARFVPEKDAKTAIDWYASLEAASGKRRNNEAYGEGERLYTNGLQSKGLEACQSCHGREALGHDIVPRLAGQNAVYMLGHLALFRSGERRNTPMTEIARYLGDDEVRALAIYLQSR
jgi:cytochrome c553